MKTIDDLRKLLATGQTHLTPLDKTAKGSIEDSNGKTHSYEIVHGWDFGLASLCDKEWGAFNLQILDYIYNAAPCDQQNLLENSLLEDAHWNWLQKHQRYHDDQYDWFFFMVDDIPQAACLVYHPKQSAVGDEPIFYIEFLAVAPWNRPNHIANQKFKGIGSILLKNVIEFADNNLKISRGFSLHSLPKAQGFYEKIGMVRYTAHDKDGMGYFEMEETTQAKFIGGIA
ncbi:GNAT family N-acetyltransferase [Vibrio alginolyticus]